jgi:hypothetical protein
VESETQPSTPLSQPLPQIPTPVSPQPPIGWLKTLLFTLLGLIVIAGSVFIGIQIEKNQTSNQQPTITPSPTETILPTTIPTVDPTADWETYIDEKGIYTIKYPSDFKTETQREIFILSKWGPDQKPNTELYDGLSLNFSFDPSLKNIDDLKTSVNNFISSLASENISDITKEMTNISIGEYSGYTFTSQGLGTHTYIFLQSPFGGAIQITNSTIDPNNQGFQDTVNQILSTFKFLN